MNKTIITLGMALCLSATSVMAGLVSNGSFESATYTANSEVGPNYTAGTTAANGQGITGWTVGGLTGGYPLYLFAATASTVSAANQWGSTTEKLATTYTGPSPDGGNFVALDGDPALDTTISQTISSLIVGKWYNVTFYWAATELQSRTGATTEQVEVSLGSDNQFTKIVSTPAQGFNGWYAQTLSFKATAISETLQFMALGTPSGLPPIVLLDGVNMYQVPEPTTLAMLGLGVALFGAARFRRRRARR